MTILKKALGVAVCVAATASPWFPSTTRTTTSASSPPDSATAASFFSSPVRLARAADLEAEYAAFQAAAGKDGEESVRVSPYSKPAECPHETAMGDRAYVRYTGRISGTEEMFDNNRGLGDPPLVMRVGEKNVLQGAWCALLCLGFATA